ncbi:MAG: endonuclease/exonuclease/phosphatase family protein [Bdellovibrionales bacterium]|nr:endonuclease/exonuclease/phosphatase family protein [Bdellovibrionales bacterium]
MKTLALRISELSSPLLVCGDFNATPWSVIFKTFLKNSGLSLSSSTPATWPTYFSFAGIPIDHCLSRGVRITNYRRGSDIGSDHWPLLFEISGF